MIPGVDLCSSARKAPVFDRELVLRGDRAARMAATYLSLTR